MVLEPSSGKKTESQNFRIHTASTKVTQSELADLQKAADARGIRLSEWIRQTLLQAAQADSRDAIQMHIFTECVGLQMLMMDALDPLLKSAGVSSDQVAAIYQRTQRAKAAKAEELLAKRAGKKFESATPK